MPASHKTERLTRRHALVGLGAGSLGLIGTASAAGQEATPASMQGHPFVGTWVVDRIPAESTDAPTVIIFTSDGAVIDPLGGTGGAWEATGPRSAAWTLVGMFDGGAGGYLLVRAVAEVDETGMIYDGSSSISLVAPDGTVDGSFPATPHGMRMPIEPVEAGGTPLGGFPTWTPPPPDGATPAS